MLGPSASLFAGTVHLNQRLFDRAVDDFEIGLRHQNAKVETVVELKYRLAAAALKMQDIGKAVSLLNEIQSVYPNFKDVPALLIKYRELNSNRNLQIFLLGTTSDFVTLCRKVALLFFPKAKVKITDISVQGNDWADILAEIETSKWSDLILFRFIRSQGTVGSFGPRLPRPRQGREGGQGLLHHRGSVQRGGQALRRGEADRPDREAGPHADPQLHRRPRQRDAGRRLTPRTRAPR